MRRWKITKNNFEYLIPSYYFTLHNIPSFQGWIEPLNLPATQIKRGERKKIQMNFQHIQVKIWKMKRR